MSSARLSGSPTRAAPADKSNTDDRGPRSISADRDVETQSSSNDSQLPGSAGSGQSTAMRDTPSGTEDGLLTETDEPLPASSPATERRGVGTGKWFNWIPFPIRRFGIAVADWCKGPPEPQNYKITPFFPNVQHAPMWLLDKLVPELWMRVCLTVVYLVMWVTAFAVVLQSSQQVASIDGYGKPGSIGCGSSYWSTNNGCGVDGMYCRPFNNSGFAFKCPANCLSYRVLNPRAVGDQEVIYRPLVVGGPPNPGSSANPTYRGDSHLCSAALHAGIISNTAGGCGVVSLIGEQSNYVASDRNGVLSVGFDSNFPLSFTFLGGVNCEARDLRWPLLGLSVAFSSVFSLFTTSAPLFFFVIFTGVFWHVGMVSDPPSHSSLAGLASTIIGKYLPAMLAAWVIFDKMGVRRTLAGLTAQFEKTILWLGACWLGALENYTFEEWIPITRLTGRDLAQQPGAKAALAFIIVLLVVIAATQVWFFRQEGRLLRYLQVYFALLVGICACLVMPNLSLRIHHYILALLLLPGTSMQTRPSLLYQGLLVGLFINGIARWGFDPILQTAAALQGDGQYFSDLPSITTPAISLAAANSSSSASTITFTWNTPSPDSQLDGISVLVNDVERYRGYFADASGDPNRSGRQFVWRRNPGAEIKEYFRFAYMSGTDSLDYTKAGVWDAKGQWIQMAPGPSKVKMVRKRGKGSAGDDDDERDWLR